ncbi:hypothetical protein KC19_1G053600 [Ceratodon purpureus]|uniref:Uncharacterized protein n=1 Tax=Ceratodon purpureus TaxID=3225 RepID=A0A8T0J1Q6_CERPU|nr:hypothetical protein KC19_1G053600 [Ceratodon purpureus]
MKWGVAWRNVKRYVKHDLKEIAFPSSLPDPPHVKAKPKPRKLTFKDYVYIVRTAAGLHAKSFTREGLTKEDWKKAGLEEQEDPEVAVKKKEAAEPSSMEELGKQTLVLLMNACSVILSLVIEQCRILDVRVSIH